MEQEGMEMEVPQQDYMELQLVEHQAMNEVQVADEGIDEVQVVDQAMECEVQTTPTKSVKCAIRKKLTPKKIHFHAM
jgi:hypothetical protein